MTIILKEVLENLNLSNIKNQREIISHGIKMNYEKNFQQHPRNHR